MFIFQTYIPGLISPGIYALLKRSKTKGLLGLMPQP
nr:MAG TPA: hypothetical protein [Caudoviricetes sp.]